MISTDFKTNFHLYENMEICEISTISDFLKTHELLHEIFEKEYNFPFDKRFESGNNFQDTDEQIVNKLLDYFNDVHFVVFKNNNPIHNELKELQDKKIIHFGMDIYALNPSKIYVLEMTKTKDLKMYDN